VGTRVDFRVASLLPLLRPAGRDRVTVMAHTVIGSSLGDVEASVISSLGPQTPDAIKSSAGC